MNMLFDHTTDWVVGLKEGITVDMLFQLNRLPSLETALKRLAGKGITIRRAMAYERSRIIRWVRGEFSELWADECAVAFGRQPIGCHIAVQSREISGFCCLESTFRNFIGPIGVARELHNNGIGRALVLSVLHEMRQCGYAYAIVGDVGEPDFFVQVAGAVEIPAQGGTAYPQKLLQ